MNSNNKSAHLKEKYLGKLYCGSRVSTQVHARELRKEPTPAEQKLWSLLRNRKLKGKKFRRQHPLAGYVLDFYCHERKLAIELDGYHHRQVAIKEYDDSRTSFLKENGITVLRFWNDEVINETTRVIKKISEQLC